MVKIGEFLISLHLSVFAWNRMFMQRRHAAKDDPVRRGEIRHRLKTKKADMFRLYHWGLISLRCEGQVGEFKDLSGLRLSYSKYLEHCRLIRKDELVSRCEQF